MSYILSNNAEEDLRGIYRYIKLNFGDAQATAYLIGLEDCLNDLSKNPAMAQKIDDIRPSINATYIRNMLFILLR